MILDPDQHLNLNI